MLGDDAFYWFMIYVAPAAGLHWMTPGEVGQYGLLTTPLGPIASCDCDAQFGSNR